MIKITAKWRNDNPETVWNKLAARLGREPTNAEAREEVLHIIRGDPTPSALSSKEGLADG